MVKKESNSSKIDSLTRPKKKTINIGQRIALVCLIVFILAGLGASFYSVSAFKKVKTFAGELLDKDILQKDIRVAEVKEDIQSDVTSAVQGKVQDTVDATIKNLQPNASLSQTGVGDKEITDVKISGKAVLITGVLAAPENTTAKLELLEAGSARLVATMSFGTSGGQTTATTAKLFTVFPGTYKVKITTVGGWNVTIIEK